MVLAFAGFALTAGAGVPVLTVPESEHDFGELWIGGPPARYDFLLKNTGDGILEILDIQWECPCISILATTDFSRKIPPGGETRLPVLLDANVGVYGEFRRSITLTTNAMKRETDLFVRGKLREFIEKNPVGIGLMDAAPAGGATGALMLTNMTDAPCTLELVGPEKQGDFRIRLQEVAKNKQWALAVTFTPDPPTMPYLHETIVTLRSSLPQQPTVTVTCSAYVRPTLELVPSEIVNDPLQPVRTVRLTNHGNEPIHLLEFHCSDSRVKGDWIPVREGYEYLIRIVTPLGFAPDGEGFPVSLKTTDAIRETVQIKVLKQPRSAPSTATP